LQLQVMDAGAVVREGGMRKSSIAKAGLARKVLRAGRWAVLAGLLAIPMAGTGYANPGGGGGGSGGFSSGPRIDAEEEYRKGIESFQAGDYKRAERHFRKVLRVAPRNANANYLMGLSLYMQEEKKDARKYLRKAVQYDSEKIGARRALGVVEAELGDADAARKELSVLEQRRAGCADPCTDASELDSAIASIKAALGSPPAGEDRGGADQDARLGSGHLKFASASEGKAAYLDAVRLINLGRFEAALRELEEASAALGPNPDILTYQGFANRKLRRFEAAHAYYRAALAIDPNHLGANEYLGEMFVELGDLASARAQLAKLESICAFGCEDAEELRRWIDAGGSRS
jgi:tetratricopeptide (TPR) repeat protein